MEEGCARARNRRTRVDSQDASDARWHGHRGGERRCRLRGRDDDFRCAGRLRRHHRRAPVRVPGPAASAAASTHLPAAEVGTAPPAATPRRSRPVDRRSRSPRPSPNPSPSRPDSGRRRGQCSNRGPFRRRRGGDRRLGRGVCMGRGTRMAAGSHRCLDRSARVQADREAREGCRLVPAHEGSDADPASTRLRRIPMRTRAPTRLKRISMRTRAPTRLKRIPMRTRASTPLRRTRRPDATILVRRPDRRESDRRSPQADAIAVAGIPQCRPLPAPGVPPTPGASSWARAVTPSGSPLLGR